MINNLKDAINHARETASKLRKMTSITNGKPYEECLECASEHEQLASWLEELAERREADKWISVKDRLPEKLVSVLAYDNNDVFVAWYDDGWKSNDSQFDKNTPIVKWLPIHKESEAENE